MKNIEKAKQKITEKIKELDIKIANIYTYLHPINLNKRAKLEQKRKDLADELLYEFE